MTKAERGSAKNLMYLCSDHHDLIDSSIAAHPRELLLAMKDRHEAAVRRAVRAVAGNLSYETLALVCAVVASQPLTAISDVELSLPTQLKINLNGLTESVTQQIEDGLAQAIRVQHFIAFQATHVPNFERRLIARIRADYEEAISLDLVADDAFEYVLAKAVENAGPRDTPEVRAAALAIVALMFEICEIFERE